MADPDAPEDPGADTGATLDQIFGFPEVGLHSRRLNQSTHSKSAGPEAQVIADRIVRGATDEAIVLMRDGGGNRTRTIEGLELALDRLSGRGVRFEPVCT